MNPHDVTSPTEEEMELERLREALHEARVARDVAMDDRIGRNCALATALEASEEENRKLREALAELVSPKLHFGIHLEDREEWHDAMSRARAALSQTKGGEE